MIRTNKSFEKVLYTQNYKFSPQERLIGVLSGGQEGGSEMSSSGAPAATKHDTIMRKYSVKNTLYHKTSPVIVT